MIKERWQHGKRLQRSVFKKIISKKKITLTQKKKSHWRSLTFSCIRSSIYSTINISRLREDWRRIFIDTKTIYIRVKYTIQQEGREEERKKERESKWKHRPCMASTLNLASRPIKTWTHLQVSAVLRSVLTWEVPLRRRLVFYIVPCCSFPSPHQPSIAFTQAKQFFTQHLASRNKTRETVLIFGNEGWRVGA